MNRRHFLMATGAAAAASSLSGCFEAANKPVIPMNSNVAKNGVKPWMQGFPPAPEHIVRFKDGSYMGWPQNGWSFSHIDELVPTRSIWRGQGAFHQLAQAPKDFSNLNIKSSDGRTLTLQQALSELSTASMAVMHKGKLVFEQYYGHCQPETRHFTASVTKSYTGTLAQTLVHEGLLDRHQLISHYLPELNNSAWADATVANVMDMQVGMVFDEDYSRMDSDVYRFVGSMGLMPVAAGLPDTVYESVPVIQKQGQHGARFAYREPNIAVLCWLVKRVTGKNLADLYSERFWQPMGMERDGYVIIDALGADTSISCTLRDFARFGEMIRNRGFFNGRQIIPSQVADSFFQGGDKDKFHREDYPNRESHSYTSQWWIRHLEGYNAVQARGYGGQSLYIDPAHELVIARFGACKPGQDTESLISPIHDAITAAV